jgi:hypothetical protein
MEREHQTQLTRWKAAKEAKNKPQEGKNKKAAKKKTQPDS